MGLLCMLGIHKYKKFETENKHNSIIYLECEKCKKRSYKEKYDKLFQPLDQKWLNKETELPQFPKKPQPK